MTVPDMPGEPITTVTLPPSGKLNRQQALWLARDLLLLTGVVGSEFHPLATEGEDAPKGRWRFWFERQAQRQETREFGR
jgi:hypothetical protein